MGDLGIAVTQSQPGAHERMLQGILGSALGSEQPPGVHPQPVSVSAYERLEGRLVTRPGELDEAIVGLTVKRPERDRRNGPADGLRGGLHLTDKDAPMSRSFPRPGSRSCAGPPIATTRATSMRGCCGRFAGGEAERARAVVAEHIDTFEREIRSVL